MTQEQNGDVTYLYLIRHGATAANEQRPYVLQGQGVNHGLSETGKRQASQLGSFLGDRKIHHVYSSPMVRAVETAQAIAQHHALDVKTIDEILEVNVGQWETLNWDEVMRDYPDEYRRFMDDPAQNGYVGGESYQDVFQRCQPVLGRLLDKHHGETVVLVAHNVVNRVLLAPLLGIELRRAKDVRQTNAGINVIKHRGGETNLITLNSVFHLDDELL